MADIDHDDILASLKDEIDKHNAIKDDVQKARRRTRRAHKDGKDPLRRNSMRFRFKSGEENDRRRHHKPRKRKESSPPQNQESAHPFPREPTAPDRPDFDHNDAFRESLFDALADDEGAQYWESVYSQPIHVYPRPEVQTEKGELELMDDDEYAAYVRLRMWEKNNPRIVLERQRSERRRKEEEERKTREREDFVRRKQQAAWEHEQRRAAGRHRADGEDGDFDHAFSDAKDYIRENAAANGTRGARKVDDQEYSIAWTTYLQAWDRLKRELLDERNSDGQRVGVSPSKRIPWPVLNGKAVIRTNIENFLRRAPAVDERSKLQLLKAERVRWHPDKIQHQFGGRVDDGTMKLVTGTFQIVDALFDETRKRSEGEG